MSLSPRKPAKHAAPPLTGLRAALRRLLANDLFAQLTLSVFAASFLPFLVPGLEAAQRQAILDTFYRVLLVIALVALRRGTDRLDRLERSFWNDLSVVCAGWLLVSLLYALFPAPSGEHRLTFYLTTELLLAIGYGAWVLAAERQPHRRHRLRSTGLERVLAWPASTVFVTGLLTYFVLIPAILNRPEYTTFLPSLLLYFTLDLYLIGRFLQLFQDCESPRWRMLYAGLAATAGGMLLADGLETMVLWHPTLEWGTPLDAFYNLQLVVLILTARLRHLDLPDPEPPLGSTDPLTAWRSGPLFPTLVTALAFPTLHFACYALGLLDVGSKSTRQSVVLCWIVMLGAIASIQHALLQRQARRLWNDWRRADKALRRSEQKARVLAERHRTREALRGDQERFRITFETTPTPLAIFTRADGRFREVNGAFEKLVSLPRRQLLGKTPGELGLWSRPRDAARLRQQLREHHSTLHRELVLRTGEGLLRRVRLTAGPMRFEGNPSLIAILREPPAELRGLADLASGSPWFDRLEAGLWRDRGRGEPEPLNRSARDSGPATEDRLEIPLGRRGVVFRVTQPKPADSTTVGGEGRR